MGEKSTPVPVRLSERQLKKIKVLGGPAWVRKQIDSAENHDLGREIMNNDAQTKTQIKQGNEIKVRYFFSDSEIIETLVALRDFCLEDEISRFREVVGCAGANHASSTDDFCEKKMFVSFGVSEKLFELRPGAVFRYKI